MPCTTSSPGYTRIWTSSSLSVAHLPSLAGWGGSLASQFISLLLYRSNFWIHKVLLLLLVVRWQKLALSFSSTRKNLDSTSQWVCEKRAPQVKHVNPLSQLLPVPSFSLLFNMFKNFRSFVGGMAASHVFSAFCVPNGVRNVTFHSNNPYAILSHTQASMVLGSQ